MRRIERTRLNRDISVDADEAFNLVTQCRKVGGLCNRAIAGPLLLLGQAQIIGLVADGHTIFAEEDAKQPVELTGDL